MASVTGTLTAVGQTGAALFLRSGETCTVNVSRTGVGAWAAQLVMAAQSKPSVFTVVETFQANASGYTFVNQTDNALLVAVQLRQIQPAESVSFTVADVLGDQILEEWRAADGTLAFRITDQGPVGGIVGSTLNVRAFGAVGDGVTDDTAAIQRAVTASANGTLLFPSGYTFAITDDIEVASPITIIGYGATLLQTVAAKTGITVSSSDVTIEGLRVRGTQYAAIDASEFAIRCEGASAAALVRRFRVRHCRIDNWGYTGVQCKFVSDFEITNCTIEQIYRTGVAILSSTDGRINNNMFEDFPGTPNAWAIIMTRDNGDSLVTIPRSARITVSGNVIKNIPVWTGIDTHGGEDIAIVGNVLEGVKKPIWCVDARNAADDATFAPKRITIAGNTMRGANDGTDDEGILVSGAGTSTGVVTEYAEGIAITGNSVYGFGSDGSSDAGIYLRWARGVTISGNQIWEPTPNGIVLFSDCLNVTVTGNQVVDAYSASAARFLRMSDDSCTVYVAGNSMRRGTKTATAVNTNGVFVATGAASCAVNLGENDWSGSAVHTVRDDVGGSIQNIRNISSTPYTVVPSDRIIRADATAAPITVALTTAGSSVGRVMTFKKIDASANAVTVTRGGSDLIDGATTYVLAAQNDSVTLYGVGAGLWNVISAS